MKKSYILALMAFLCFTIIGYGQVSDLIISEYGEGSSGNSKYIEIYNGTGSTVDLSNYQFWRVTNGGPWPEATLSLSGNLLNGNTYVVANNFTDTPGADLYSGFCSWNGDDAVGLAKDIASVFTLIDVIGTDGADPGTHWNVGTSGETRNDRLTRKATVCDPNANWTTSSGTDDASSEWSYTAYSTGAANAGHTVSCVTTTVVELASTSYSVGENNGSIDICIDIFNESATNITEVDLVLTTGNTPHVTTYTTQTITFPAGSSAQICETITVDQNVVCGDTTAYTFQLQNVSGGDSAAIGTDDTTVLTVDDDDGTNGPFRTLSFESGDDWGYTATGGSLSTIAGKYYGTQSYELTGNHRIITDNVNLSSYTNVTVSVAFAADGPDNGDDLYMDISYDDGANWFAANRIKLVDGFGNASLNVGDTNALDPTTVGSNPYSFAIAPSETQVRFRLRASGVEAGEYYYVDDIILSGDTCVTPCTPTHSVTNFVPSSGPAGTNVTITGTGFTNLTEVAFDGITSLNVTFIDANTLIAEVPIGASTGEITVTENSCDIDTADFTVILNNGSCGSVDDLIITEIYDHSSGSLGYIEVYNGTGAAINVSNYYVRRYGSNANYVANNFTDYFFSTGTPSVTSIADGAILIGKISSDADVIPAAQGPDFSFGNAGFSGINGDDIFELRNSSGVIDVYQVPNGVPGYTARRRLDTAGPIPTSPGGDPSQWFPHSTSPSTADLGTFPFVGLSNFPVVDASPSDVTTCAAQAQFVAAASPGDGGTLAYEWYYNEGDGVATGWTQITGSFPLASVTGFATNTLTIGSGFANYNNYQFYCLVTENGTCSTATDAAQIQLDVAVWSAAGWSTPPTIDTVAIINDDYDTNGGGVNEDSFEACRLIVNSGYTLTVHDNDYVDVVNDVIVNGNTALDYGEIIINPKGAFIQRGDDSAAGNFTLSGTGRSEVSKRTAPLVNWYDYTYWSSPVVGELVSSALFTANPNRRFFFDANNYLDVSPADDIDDNADDWVLVNTANPAQNSMVSGRGYAATHSTAGFISPNTGYIYVFEGALQTGNVTYPLAYNAANTDHWNLVGNPYPSAIDVDDLFAMNTSIKDVVYLWSHHRAPLDTNPGNEVLNFDQNDYIIFNNAMPVGNGSDINGDGVVNGLDVPEKYIPSGQSFFVSSSSANPIIFKNSLRISGDDSNNQFFRLNENVSDSNTEVNNKLWVNLSSDTGAYGQTGIAYLNEATDGFDGIGYDTKRNMTVNTAASIYTLIPETPNLNFGIQAKAKQTLTLDEVIPLGFSTQLTQPSIYTLKLLKITGEFFNSNTIYLKDKYLNITHNFTESDYNFTSDPGVFNNRFEIVFQSEALSISENEIDASGLSIIELSDGNVKFSVGQQLTITKVDIIDIVGRTIYQLEANNSEEIFNLSRLSQSTYIAKVTLSNGQIITKKGIKRH